MEVQLRRLGPCPRIRVLNKPENCLSKSWLCGRGTSCHIYTRSRYASRCHFSITFKNGEYYIKDLNSANGTYVNGEMIMDEQILTFGSTIGVGVPCEMFNSPDCIVYKFEPEGAVSDLHIPEILFEREKQLHVEKVRLITEFEKEAELIKKYISDVKEHLKITEVSRKSELEDVLLNCLKSKSSTKVNVQNSGTAKECNIQLLLDPNNENVENTAMNENSPITVAGNHSASENMNNIVPSHEVDIKKSRARCRPLCDSEGPTPSKLRKIKNSKQISEQISHEKEVKQVVEEAMEEVSEEEVRDIDEEKVKQMEKTSVKKIDKKVDEVRNINEEEVREIFEEEVRGVDKEEVKETNKGVDKEDVRNIDVEEIREICEEEIREIKEEEVRKPYEVDIRNIDEEEIREIYEEEVKVVDSKEVKKVGKKEVRETGNEVGNEGNIDMVEIREVGEGEIREVEEEEKRKTYEVDIRNIDEEDIKEIDEEEVEEIDLESQKVYEAVTQTDESELEPGKVKPDMLIYSQTEELIEISDNEDADIVSNWKQAEAKVDPVEDDEVVFLQIVTEPPKETSLPLVFQMEDDFTDTDKRWVEKLLKVKKEEQQVERLIMEPMIEMNLDADSLAVPTDITTSMTETVEPVTVPLGDPKEKRKNKRVSFNLEVEVKYFKSEESIKVKSKIIKRGKERFLNVIYNLCNWNAQWLQECDKISSDIHPPGLCDHPCRKIRNYYLNHSHYMMTFVPNLLFQIWENIKRKCVNSYNFFRQSLSFDNHADYPAEKLTVWNCTGLVKSVKNHKNFLREGHLVVMRVHQATQTSTVQPDKYSKTLGYLIFGLVESKTYEKLNDQKIHPKLAEERGALTEEFYIVKLEILVKLRPNLNIDREKLVQVKVVHQISPELRKLRAVCCLPLSPLCNPIVKLTPFQLPEPQTRETVFKVWPYPNFAGPLTHIQKEIVLKLSEGCLSMDSLLYSLYGAAGTGKSHVVIALIWQLLFSSNWSGKKPKIIYCTRDGAPLDDMVLRLKNSMSDQNSTFNLIRASHSKFIKQEIKNLCLFTQSKNANKYSLEREAEVLKKADVICTSCTSPVMAKLIKAFETRRINCSNQKMVCIIDEAVSTRETDCIIPLLLEVTHLILVGDIYQARPSSSSEITRSLRVDIPLFLRIYQHYKKNMDEQSRPFFTLRTQFRISSQLSEFLNKNIYSNPFIVPKFMTKVDLRSYLLLVDKFEPTNKLLQTKHENILVWKLVYHLHKLQDLLQYAVITCNEAQSVALRRIIHNSKLTSVEVNSVEAFHGRQFDVVVFLYDGSDIHHSVITTAITRAKISLFIVSLKQSLAGNSWFRMLTTDAEKRNYLKYVEVEMKSDDFKDIFTT